MSSIADAIHLIFFVALGVIAVFRFDGFFGFIVFPIFFVVLFIMAANLIGFPSASYISEFALGVVIGSVVKFMGRKTLGFY
jgi:hypothetical protein